jgi:hypothetical protein
MVDVEGDNDILNERESWHWHCNSSHSENSYGKTSQFTEEARSGRRPNANNERNSAAGTKNATG